MRVDHRHERDLVALAQEKVAPTRAIECDPNVHDQ
jgi:hypothetical protein